MLDSVARAHRVQSTLSLLHTDEGLLIESTEPAHRVQYIHPPFDLPLFLFVQERIKNLARLPLLGRYIVKGQALVITSAQTQQPDNS